MKNPLFPLEDQPSLPRAEPEPAFSISSQGSFPSSLPALAPWVPKRCQPTGVWAPQPPGVQEVPAAPGPLGARPRHDSEKGVYSLLKGIRRMPEPRGGKGHPGNWVSARTPQHTAGGSELFHTSLYIVEEISSLASFDFL